MTNASAPWWDVIHLRDEIKASDGAIDDVQMSLHDAVFGTEGVGAGRTPYADAGYYGDIPHPTGSLASSWPVSQCASGCRALLRRARCGVLTRRWAAASPTASSDCGTNRLAGTLRQWETEILAYFDTGLTNGATEGRNLIVKQVKRQGFGYTNPHNYRLRVLYRCA